MKVGIVDTTFARMDMGAIALDELKMLGHAEVERRTVPGIKDLAVECLRMLGAGDGMQGAGCDIVLALGMVGGAPIDAQCAHEASLGIQQAKLQSGKHIIEVFVHEREGWSTEEFRSICESRVRKHARNAFQMAGEPGALVRNAGRGIRQGKEDEGPRTGTEGITLAIVAARFNEEITGGMEKKAAAKAGELGARFMAVRVPGVFDIPLVAKKMLMDKKVDAVVALGAVVRGETAHDEVITKSTCARLSELSLEFDKPVALGIIGHGAAWELAQERAGDYAERAVEAAVELVRTLRRKDYDQKSG
ncbi:MAG: riboflavin synthase [Candidatus Micrarchaeota archaeon]